MVHTFIFIGPSGSGKGTQREHLMTHLKETQENANIFFVETGQRFRDFIKGDGRANRRAREMMEEGVRAPDFLALYMWSGILLDRLNDEEEEHVIFDGTPRSKNEAIILDTALNFFERSSVFVIFIDVSRSWATERLTERQRQDDDYEGIQKRLDWYEKDVAPAVEYYRTHPTHHFIEVNGEQSREEVRHEMLRKIQERIK